MRMGGALVWGALLAAEAASAQPIVRVGLEKVEAEGGAPLRGKRVGLVVHAASVTRDGRHAIDVLRGSGVDVRRLFAPEHGLRARAAAGEAVAGGVDAGSGLPLVSLYGTQSKPAAADLRDLDALVFDLQDVGVRFYTYVSTLILCLEAAAETGIDLVVLDRPNPLGGDRVEGPVADPAVPKSLVNTAPGPLVHGLTAGEMARFVNGRRTRPARVTVVPLEGWRRDMTWSETGWPWVPPSPNLRSAEAALAYPGTCLLEGTNVAEGRGTEAPFLLFGAPWLRAGALVRDVRVPGFTLEPIGFTSHAGEAAPNPKYEGQACAGVRVRVTDQKSVQAYRLGVALLAAIRREHTAFRWNGDGSAFDRLVGTPRLRVALERGEGVDAVVAADGAAIAAYREQRRRALLY